MSWGSAFKRAWDSASDDARKLAGSIAKDVKAGMDYAVTTGRTVAHETYDAAVATKNAAVAVGVAAKNATVKAAVAVKNTAVAAENAVVSATVRAGHKVEHAVVGAAKHAYGVSAAAVKHAYTRVHAVFGRQPVGHPIQPCPEEQIQDTAKAKAAKLARLAKRKDLIDQGRKRASWRAEPERSQLLNAANRLEKNNVVVERAKLADDVYNSRKEPPPLPPAGWTRVRQDDNAMAELGLDKDELNELLAPSGFGFRAEMYYSDFEGKKTLVIAMKGTEPNPREKPSEFIEDWKENLLQAGGADSHYYKQAKAAAALAKALQRHFGDSVKLEFTGHSLGGGMASEASIAAGLDATTFNPAGLHRNTISSASHREEVEVTGMAGEQKVVMGGIYPPEAMKRIKAYHVQGEILTTVQNREVQTSTLTAGRSGLPAAVGTRYELPAIDEMDGNGQGYRRPINDLNPAVAFQRHEMDHVIDGIEQQKSDDVYLLESLAPLGDWDSRRYA